MLDVMEGLTWRYYVLCAADLICCSEVLVRKTIVAVSKPSFLSMLQGRTIRVYMEMMKSSSD